MSLPWLPSPASGVRRGSWSWGSAVKACNSPPNTCLHSPFLCFHPCGSLWITYFLSVSEMNADLEFPYSAYPSKSSIFFKIFSLKWLFFLLWIREQSLTMEVICQWPLGSFVLFYGFVFGNGLLPKWLMSLPVQLSAAWEQGLSPASVCGGSDSTCQILVCSPALHRHWLFWACQV